MSIKKNLQLSAICIAVSLSGQTASNFTVVQNQSAITTNVTRPGYNTGSSGYLSSTNYNLFFGRTNSSTTGTVPKLQSFQFNSQNYVPFTQSGTIPYDRIAVNRRIAAGMTAQNPNKFTGFFENNLISGNDTYFKAEYIETLEDLINSYVINRGVDNIFSNSTTGTTNNVERVDLILDAGVVMPANINLNKLGALLLDRGGNDNYKVAVITSLDATGKVSGLGNLISRNQANFSSTGYTLTSTVFQNANSANPSAAENLIRPSENISSQAISGDFVTFSELGVAGGQVIYGISVFPNDVLQGTHDLINLSNVPSDTDGTVGGLDFMGGGGFFVASDVAPATVNGNVYRDIDGNTAINGTGIGSAASLPLYAYLLASNNTIISKVAVDASGSLSFPSTILEVSNTYTVAIDTRNVTGTYSFSSPILPSGWEIVGEDYGLNNLAGTGVESGVPNLRIPVLFNSTNPSVNNIKFGILPAEDICTQAVNGSTFSWDYNGSNAPSNPVTQSFNQPAANYGFVLDITKLDNSFNMIINGTPLATQEIEFQSSGTSGINVQFVDNSSYETNTPFIYNMTGTQTDPIIRVNISPTGTVTMFGRKSSGGPLFPLKLVNGNAFNTITWNTSGTNTVVATQNVVGATNMSGRGYGLNRVVRSCIKPGATGTPLGYTDLGITTKANLNVNNWPKNVPNGYMALDSAGKGLVITHVTTAQRDALVAVEGMVIYNTDLGCVQLYRGNNPSVDNARRGWNCITKGCNE